MHIALICTGDELLKGATVNTNLAFLGGKLLEIGIIPEVSLEIPDSRKAIRFRSALHRAGVPVLLRDAAFLKERLQGTERVGIVPKGVIPAYCQSHFPGEQGESFMNLPEENRAQFAQATRWQRLEPLELL